MFRYSLYKAGQFLVNVLPLSLAYKFAIALSDCQHNLSSIDRLAVANNLKIIIPDQTRHNWATREVFRNFGRYLVEFLRMKRRLNESYIKQNIKLINIEKLKDVAAHGKGGIILTAHIGNWELGAALLSELGFPILAVALPHQSRLVNDFFNLQRESKGIKVVPSNIAVRKCSKWLRSNKFISMVGDRVFSPNGETLPFLGRKAVIPKGPAVFSIKTGAPIIPTFLIRENEDQFSLIVCDPIYPPEIDDPARKKEILVKYMKTYIVILEEKIKQFPEQWLMFREFWSK